MIVWQYKFHIQAMKLLKEKGYRIPIQENEKLDNQIRWKEISCSSFKVFALQSSRKKIKKSRHERKL